MRSTAADADHRGMTTPRRTVTRSPFLLFVPLLFVPALAVGCGGGDSIADLASEKIAEAGAGEGYDVDIDSESGEISVTNEDGSFSASSSGELPDGWPEEIPLPDDLKIATANAISSDTGQVFNVVGEVPDGDAAWKAITAELADAGWNEVQKATGNYGAGTSSSATYDNGTWSVTVGAQSLDDGEHTFSYTVVPSES